MVDVCGYMWILYIYHIPCQSITGGGPHRMDQKSGNRCVVQI